MIAKNPRPENVALFGAPLEGGKKPAAKSRGCWSSEAMEYWSNGLELTEGLCKSRTLHKVCLSWVLRAEYPVRVFPILHHSVVKKDDRQSHYL